ncbi:YajG family lipoprotein [Geomonas subterranea]|uniref:YajG family lipoprotein n=1 Tax=Geomonas subterranea TaxID=2847989 RepID=A0ABX8LFY5_9BACT|nr:YajG family lipoprotein [Geomonas subterranea]QXE89806.1 YajG family lipoprotein [Geomonas subterranea]QXM08076.1 YajG family lipoprotein [Geomonas subterranea]
MKKKLVVLGLAAIAVMGISGCAITTDTIAVNYQPQTGVTPLQGAQSVVVDVKVKDNRLIQDKVSCKKNGFGMEMARIITAEDVNITFKKALEQELKARGFAIGPEALVTVDAELNKFYSDFKMGFVSVDALAECSLGVTVKGKKGNLLFSRQYMTEGAERNGMIAGGDNARLALEQALAQGMQKLFADPAFIAALLDASKS